MNPIRYQSPNFEPCARIAGFDMDWTLIRTKSGRIFPKTPNDWTLWHKHVAPRVQALHADGYAICIFTNQEGVSKGRVKAEELVIKFIKLGTALNVPILCQAATQNDVFRKPRTGMWTLLETEWKAKHGIIVDRAKSLYVGDAAGRPSNSVSKRKEDFHDVDYKFALNVGVGRFAVPEECFQTGESVPDKSTWTLHVPEAFVPSKFISSTRTHDNDHASMPMIDPTKPVLWLCVGPPAAGKSTFCTTYASNVACINQDCLKTRAKCMKQAKAELIKGKPCIVDGTHRDIATRAHYVHIAKELQVPCYCLWFDRSKDIAMHMNALRMLTGGAHVPKVAMHTYFKRAEPPQMVEGFKSIMKVPWRAKFTSEEVRTLAGQYLV